MLVLGLALLQLAIYKRFRKLGLLHFMSPKFQNLMRKWSFFDILCQIVYFGTLAKNLKSIAKAFILSGSP